MSFVNPLTKAFVKSHAKAFLAAAGALPPAVVGEVLNTLGVQVDPATLGVVSAVLAFLVVKFGPANTVPAASEPPKPSAD